MTDKVREDILELLTEGLSLVTICRRDGMPTTRTVQRWQKEDEEFAVAVTHAREDGYHKRAEEAVEKARNATDAGLARLAFDADRWYLGKLSNAFNDNKAQKHEHTVDLSDRAKAWLGLTS